MYIPKYMYVCMYMFINFMRPAISKYFESKKGQTRPAGNRCRCLLLIMYICKQCIRFNWLFLFCVGTIFNFLFFIFVFLSFHFLLINQVNYVLVQTDCIFLAFSSNSSYTILHFRAFHIHICVHTYIHMYTAASVCRL